VITVIGGGHLGMLEHLQGRCTGKGGEGEKKEREVGAREQVKERQYKNLKYL